MKKIKIECRIDGAKAVIEIEQEALISVLKTILS